MEKNSRTYLKLLFITILFIVPFLLSSCLFNNEVSVNDVCKSYASDYEIVRQDGNDTVVTINAPDFEKIIKVAYDKDNDFNLDGANLKTEIEKYPELKKDYSVSVDNLDREHIEDAFLKQVAGELVISAIENTTYEERWSTEE